MIDKRLRADPRHPISLVVGLAALAGIIVLAVIPGGAQQFSNVAPIFEIGLGARSLAMGGAFVGLADDETTLLYNPAGLAFLEERGLASLYSNQFGAIDYGALGYAQKRFGVAVLTLSSTGIPQRDGTGTKTGNIDYTSFGGVGALGIPVPLRLPFVRISVGGQLRYYQNNLPGSSGSGLLISLGGLVDPGQFQLGRLRLGVTIDAFGAINYGSRSEPLIPRWRVGASFEPATVDVVFAVDYEQDGSDGTIHLGGEFRVQMFAVRLGIYGNAAAGISVTAGGGVRFRMFQLDYAYLAHPQLPDAQRLSLGLRF